MVINRDVWVFGLTVAIISGLVSIVSMQFGVKSITIFNTVFASMLLFVMASLGFFLGQKISKHSFTFKHAFFAGVFAFVFIRNLNQLLNLDEYSLPVSLLVLLSISALLAWRLPQVFKLKNNDSH